MMMEINAAAPEYDDEDAVGTRQKGRESANEPMDYQDRLEFALDATDTGLWTYDSIGQMLELDGRTKSIWGFAGDDGISQAQFASSVHPDDLDKATAMLEEAPASDAAPVLDVDFRIRRFDTGAERCVALRLKRIARGNSTEIVGTARDITDARRHDDQIHVLMREVTHRSKNLLAIIQAMARQTVKDSLTAADFETRFSSRLRGLSFSHEILAAHDWRGAYLGDLARGHLSQVLEQNGDRIEIDGPSLFITPEAAQNIGLALNELTSNALKFGALSGPSGRIAVEWQVESETGKANWLHFIWNEYGGSAIRPPLRQGFGHKVMERVVARALDGLVNMTFAPTGLQWSLRIPMSHVVGRRETAA